MNRRVYLGSPHSRTQYRYPSLLRTLERAMRAPTCFRWVHFRNVGGGFSCRRAADTLAIWDVPIFSFTLQPIENIGTSQISYRDACTGSGRTGKSELPVLFVGRVTNLPLLDEMGQITLTGLSHTVAIARPTAKLQLNFMRPLSDEHVIIAHHRFEQPRPSGMMSSCALRTHLVTTITGGTGTWISWITPYRLYAWQPSHS